MTTGVFTPAQRPKRYADPGHVITENWQTNTDYVRTKQPANVDNLSPAEKYDLLVGTPTRR